MDRLTDLQSRVLRILADIDPAFTLTGGAALVGFHLGHRTTRDLDLFWHGRSSIADVRREVLARLRTAGLSAHELRSLDSFSSIEVRDDRETVVIDLVAEPVAPLEPPQARNDLGVEIRVDTPGEILVNKLCALLHRSEPRDLLDILTLVRAGGDLTRSIEAAPKKDAGFSSLTLGWVLQGWDLPGACRAAGLSAHIDELMDFRDELLRRAAGNAPPPA